MNEYLLLILGIPAGILCSYITNYEKNIWKKYFPPIAIISLITSIIFFYKNKAVSFTAITIFIMLLTWSKSSKWFDKK